MARGSKDWPTLEDNLEYCIQKLGEEKVAMLLSPEARLMGLPPEVRLSGLKRDDLLKALSGLSREDLLTVLTALEKQPPTKPRQRNGKSARKKKPR